MLYNRYVPALRETLASKSVSWILGSCVDHYKQRSNRSWSNIFARLSLPDSADRIIFFLAKGYPTTMHFVAPLLALLTVHAAAKTVFLSEPSALWQSAISPVGEGNECAFSPTSNPILVCTSIDGSATALQPNSATPQDVVWNYTPAPNGTTSSTSGVTFSSTGSWFVYGTTDVTSTQSVWYVVIGANKYHASPKHETSVSPLSCLTSCNVFVYQPCPCGVRFHRKASVGFGISWRSMFRNACRVWKR